MKQTLYDILGVARDASFEDIEVAYAKRFEVLKTETSWDSNRLVMLNEAREVLSDASRRAAYDASLDAPSPPPGARHRQMEEDEPSGSSTKWVVAVVILIAVAVWWTMREEAPSDQPASAPTAQQAPAQSGSGEEDVVVLRGGDVSNIADQDTISEIDAVTAPVDTESDETGDSSASETAAAPAAVQSNPTPSTTLAAAASTSIIGRWNCFEPVTGRNNEYGFADDGTLTINSSGGDTQTLSYEMEGERINLTDTDPPGTIDVEEFSARKMILNSSGAGQRIVCTR